MMLGGGMMMGIGLLMMLLVIVLPVLLITAIFAGIFGMAGRQNKSPVSVQSPLAGPSVIPSTGNIVPQQAQPAERSCAHCGAGLQPGWAHCPQCGAPVNQ